MAFPSSGGLILFLRRGVLAPWFATTLVVAAVDTAFSLTGPPQAQFVAWVYAFSLIPSFLFWGVFSVLQRSAPRSVQIGVAALAALAFWLLIVSSYHLYFGLGEYLSPWMLRFMNDEPSNWKSYLHSYILGGNSVWFAILALAVFWVWFPSRREKRRHRGPVACAAALSLCFVAELVFLQRVALNFKNYKMPMDTSVFLAVKGLWKRRSEFEGLVAYQRRILPEPRVPLAARIDVVLFILESTPRNGLAFYGDTPGKMPFLEKTLASEAEDWVVFQSAYTNGTFTDVSMSSLFTSVSPARPNRDLFEAPLPWDWVAKAGMRSAMVSSQKLDCFDMPRFLKTPALGFYADQATLGHPLVNDLGMDDLIALDAFLETLKPQSVFDPLLAVFNNNAMHSPFQKESSRLTQEKNLPPMTAALRIVDTAFERTIQTLRDSGRYDRTLFIVTSDHGDHPKKWRGLVRALNFHEEIVRIPFLVKMPKSWASTQKHRAATLRSNSQRNVSNLDILPTVLDSLGFLDALEYQPAVSRLDGSSLLRPVSPNRWIVTTNANGNKQVEQVGFGIVRGNERLACASHQGCRFYDIADDPEEQRNRLKEISVEALSPWASLVRSSEIFSSHARRMGTAHLFDPPTKRD